MLKDNFFSIIGHTVADDRKIDFTVGINPEHIIYKVHFPNNPITPGVCIIQMATELFSFFRQINCKVCKIKTAKFLHPIIPTTHRVINYKMEWEKDTSLDHVVYGIKIQVYYDDIIFSKINMYMKENDLCLQIP
jgi:3-hydroxyacyl-[acyl-carrier-protein] dehydratase